MSPWGWKTSTAPSAPPPSALPSSSARLGISCAPPAATSSWRRRAGCAPNLFQSGATAWSTSSALSPSPAPMPRTDAMAYHKMAEYEASCLHAPFFCPEKGCVFVGTTVELVDHLTAQHKWPMTVFEYFVPFEVTVKAGVHILCCRGDKGKADDVFLLNVSWLGSPVRVVSLLHVHLHAAESRFGCSVGFSWFKGHYQVSREDTIQSTSLSDGLPVDYLCVVPEAGFGGRGPVVLRVTIDREMVYGDDYDKLFEEDDDDQSYIYNEEEDDDGSSEEENDDGSSEDEDEEDDDDGEV